MIRAIRWLLRRVAPSKPLVAHEQQRRRLATMQRVQDEMTYTAVEWPR